MAESNINLSQVNFRINRRDVYFGDVVYRPGGTLGPLVQIDYQIVVLYDGSLELAIEDETVWLKPGQAILLHPGRNEYFQFAKETTSRHGWCTVRVNAMPVALKNSLEGITKPIPWTSHLQHLFEMGQKSAVTISANSDLEIQRFVHLTLHIMAEFAAEALRGEHTLDDRRIEQMQAAIASQYANPMTLSDLARAAGLSKQHLLKICRDRKEPPPLQQLYLHRLQNADDLLIHTGLSIKEISERCGFENPFHFSRKFREWRGFSPRAYRKLVQ